MSLNQPGLTKTFIAATLIPRWTVVALAAGDNQVELATDPTGPLLGVSAEPADTPAGKRIDVVFNGIVEVRAGGVVAKGAELMVDAQGRVVTATSTNERIGRALSAANGADDLISIEINKF